VGRVVILGLDGATFSVIDPLIDQGHAPNLARLRREGLWGKLRTTVPPVTPAAWSSFATGKNPGKHRIFDFVYREPGTYTVTPVDARRRVGPTLWELADKAGLKTCVFNVPLTYPTDPLVNGAMVSGLLTPSGVVYTHPPGLCENIERITGGFQPGVEQAYSPGREGPFLRGIVRGLEQRIVAARYLWEQENWDLFIAVFNETDTVQHGLWHAWDPTHPRHTKRLERDFARAFAEVYGRLDEELGWYLEHLRPDDALLVMSDHGAGQLRSFFFVNNWLLEQGHLRLRDDPATTLKKMLFDSGLTPNSIFNMVLRLGGGSLKHRATFGRGQGWLARMFLSFANVDWERTRAYSFGNMGPIWVNLRGREPGGAVQPGRPCDHLLKDLRRRLLRLKAPDTGLPMVGQVWRREELYTGPYLTEAPDLLFMPRDMEYVAFGDYEFAGSRLFEGSMGISASHRMDGVFFGCGARFGPARELEGARIEDITPTVLHLLGLPVRSDMDGRSLAAGEPTVVEAAPVQPGETGSVYSEEEKAEVQRRLRDLGYLA